MGEEPGGEGKVWLGGGVPKRRFRKVNRGVLTSGRIGLTEDRAKLGRGMSSRRL